MTRSRWSISAPCLLNSRHKEGFSKPNFLPTCSRVSGSDAAQRAVTRAPSGSRLCSVMRFLGAAISPSSVQQQAPSLYAAHPRITWHNTQRAPVSLQATSAGHSPHAFRLQAATFAGITRTLAERCTFFGRGTGQAQCTQKSARPQRSPVVWHTSAALHHRTVTIVATASASDTPSRLSVLQVPK